MREDIKINLIDQEDFAVELNQLKKESPELKNYHHPKTSRGGFFVKFKKISIGIVIVSIIIFIVFGSSILFSNENLIKGLNNLNLLAQMGSLITAGDRQLKGEDDDKINALLIGIGGADHEGGTLADTIILGSLQPSTNKIAMMSLPRDLYVKSDEFGWSKINAVHAYAEKKYPKQGGEIMSKFLNQTLNTEIHYYAVIDFDGFEKLIDEFGGIDVYVDNDLIDNSYPIRGKENSYPIESRFERLNIKKGWQHFDGATALKYARSRHALGVEGSDFARSKRQQKILLALKDKILKYNLILNPGKISALFKAYQENVSTNLELWEILKLLKMAENVDYQNPITFSLVDGPTPLLYDQIVGGAYVLLPYGGNYDKISLIWNNLFTVGTSTDIKIDRTKWEEFKDEPQTTTTTKDNPATTTNPTDSIYEETDGGWSEETESFSDYRQETAKIDILNGTLIEGWASKESTKLKNKGFTINRIGNAPTKGYTEIKIYDLSGGKNPKTISELQIIYGVKNSPPPANLSSNADIVIILGQ